MLLSSFAKRPTRHASQGLESAEKRPGGQALQPSGVCIAPGSQLRQKVLPNAANLPIAHEVHSDEPGDVATSPPEQGEHLTALETLENRPASQAWHERASPGRYSPGTHGTSVGAAVGSCVGDEVLIVGSEVGMGVGHA